MFDPDRRARISSRIVFGTEATNYIRQEQDPNFSGSYEVVITSNDGLIILEYEERVLEVLGPAGLRYPAEDGTWQEKESPSAFSPFLLWADTFPFYTGEGHDPVVVGYEMLADTPTVHLREAGTPTDMWADTWFDASGKLVRAVLDASGTSNQAWQVWDVQSLAPEYIGPLSPNP